MVRVRPRTIDRRAVISGQKSHLSGALLNILVFYSCWAYICLYSW